ncbi:putative transmembrane protein [Gregarina niphandrodes]|uniref:Transmembrane protein n=1 Tax=Gregarina niphandrodes TaxID=110365 RepID=A0A023AYV6_GRENI|nr:putative transmembrane protein [Gregarina niphandrodes]EZG43857.1 putative transmembrane protein [Gregarina niphandrodes]|eukprot:XP_011132945.1 putative transmembrane protein [Gregarina niphandrodes]
MTYRLTAARHFRRPDVGREVAERSGDEISFETVSDSPEDGRPWYWAIAKGAAFFLVPFTFLLAVVCAGVNVAFEAAQVFKQNGCGKQVLQSRTFLMLESILTLPFRAVCRWSRAIENDGVLDDKSSSLDEVHMSTDLQSNDISSRGQVSVLISDCSDTEFRTRTRRPRQMEAESGQGITTTAKVKAARSTRAKSGQEVATGMPMKSVTTKTEQVIAAAGHDVPPEETEIHEGNAHETVPREAGSHGSKPPQGPTNGAVANSNPDPPHSKYSTALQEQLARRARTLDQARGMLNNWGGWCLPRRLASRVGQASRQQLQRRPSQLEEMTVETMLHPESMDGLRAEPIREPHVHESEEPELMGEYRGTKIGVSRPVKSPVAVPSKADIGYTPGPATDRSEEEPIILVEAQREGEFPSGRASRWRQRFSSEALGRLGERLWRKSPDRAHPNGHVAYAEAIAKKHPRAHFSVEPHAELDEAERVALSKAVTRTDVTKSYEQTRSKALKEGPCVPRSNEPT